MMTKAMEVCGTQGSFEKTCDITMTVLREEKVSVMAMLEAFVFDPLINWRLLQSRPTQVCFCSCSRMFCYGLFAHSRVQLVDVDVRWNNPAAVVDVVSRRLAFLVFSCSVRCLV
jgi:phosphatidylinositol kinase/protein kinase (PI-3  family)